MDLTLKLLVVLTMIPRMTYAADDSIAVGIADRSTGNEIHATCLEWSADHAFCNSVQFVLVSDKQITSIGPHFDGAEAALSHQKFKAPQSDERQESIDPDKPFEVSDAAYDPEVDGICNYSNGSIMAFTALSGIGGLLLTWGFGDLGYRTLHANGAYKTPFLAPFVTQRVSPINISTEQVSTNISYARNVQSVESSTSQQWAQFWSQAATETPEQRVATFSSLYPSGVLSLSNRNSIPSNYILVRIEYSNITKSYNFVFIPPNMTSQYELDLSTQLAKAQQRYISEIANQKVIVDRNSAATRVAKQRLRLFFGVGFGAIGALLISPVIADFIHDAVMYPAEAIRLQLEKKHNSVRTKKLALEWGAAWSALLIDRNSEQPLMVSTPIFSAIQAALQVGK